jgi:hypothetical protein
MIVTAKEKRRLSQEPVPSPVYDRPIPGSLTLIINSDLPIEDSQDEFSSSAIGEGDDEGNSPEGDSLKPNTEIQILSESRGVTV